jgi:competence protein ComEC
MQRLRMPARDLLTTQFAGAWRLAGECFAAERSRWALWLPVAFGGGIALYFSLAAEPAPWTGAATASLLGATALAGVVRAEVVRIMLWLAVVMACGFSVAQFRTMLVAAPVLEQRTGPAWIEGQVREVHDRIGDRRILLDRLKIPGLSDVRTPERVRIVLRSPAPALQPGDRITVRAVLHPPPGPAAPGAFDFARKAYFERLGGVGYAVSAARILTPADRTGFSLKVAALRQSLTERIRAAVAGPQGGIAAALMTGERGGIPESVMEAMRDSGLAHLLAISGLHIGLVAGLLFFAVRFGLALHERIALRAPTKKIAALAALAGAAAYLLISGGTVPTQRAFLMLALVMVAICIDRQPISMNMVAWAAAAILLITPESLTGVSFQMSFAAVIALVAAYERHAGSLHARRTDHGLPRPVRYVGAVLLSTLVAGLATAPFALFHFNRVAVFGMVANLIAVPLTGFWIMPLAVLAFALMPFGLERLALTPMSWGIGALIATAERTQALPGAAFLVRAMPDAGLALIVAGGLWLCLWRTRWRVLGIVGIVCGLLTIPGARPPDLLIGEAGTLIAVRAPDGGLALSGRSDSFAASTWLRRSGEDEARPWPRPAQGDDWLRCDRVGCIYSSGRRRIALVRDVAALEDDCARADVIVSSVPVSARRCPGPELIIDRFSLWREGAHALWFNDGGIRVASVREGRGIRPWHPPLPRRGQ